MTLPVNTWTHDTYMVQSHNIKEQNIECEVFFSFSHHRGRQTFRPGLIHAIWIHTSTNFSFVIIYAKLRLLQVLKKIQSKIVWIFVCVCHYGFRLSSFSLACLHCIYKYTLDGYLYTFWYLSQIDFGLQSTIYEKRAFWKIISFNSWIIYSTQIAQ